MNSKGNDQISNINQLAQAFLQVVRNAYELYEEAIILIRHKRYARAYTLIQFAYEEISKILIFEFAAYDVQNGIELYWKDINWYLRSHKAKIAGAHIAQRALNNLDQETRNINRQKNLSIYSDLYRGKFLRPSEIFNPEFSKGQVVGFQGFFDNFCNSFGLEKLDDFNEEVVIRFFKTRYEENHPKFEKYFIENQKKVSVSKKMKDIIFPGKKQGPILDILTLLDNYSFEKVVESLLGNKR